MQRRSLIKLGVAGGALFALLGGGLAWWQPGWAQGRLTSAGRQVFTALSRAVLGPLLPAADVAALAAQLARIEATIGGLPPALQAELAQLLALLATPPARVALTGLRPAWEEADDATLQAMLHALRHSSLVVRQQVYHALRDLVNAAWFADAAAWRSIGYPGPQRVGA